MESLLPKIYQLKLLLTYARFCFWVFKKTQTILKRHPYITTHSKTRAGMIHKILYADGLTCSNWPSTDKSGNKKVAQAVIFGLGSMFNHSTQDQNVGWIRDHKRLSITYRALRDITAGEELCRWKNVDHWFNIINNNRHIIRKSPNI